MSKQSYPSPELVQAVAAALLLLEAPASGQSGSISFISRELSDEERRLVENKGGAR